MNGISGLASSLRMASDAMMTHSVGMQVTAHNIANVNTDGFNPQRALYATGPNGNGVDLQAVIRDRMPPFDSASEAPATESGVAEFFHQSGTELAREFPHMIITQRTFEANATMARAADEMLGTLLSIKA